MGPKPGNFSRPDASPSLIQPPPAPQSEDAPLLFQSFTRPIDRPQERIPHLGHMACWPSSLLFGLIGTVAARAAALHFHLFGVTSIAQAATDYRYALGSQAAQYFITFARMCSVFPILWRKPFFDGMHWHGATALRRTPVISSAQPSCVSLSP